MGCGGSKTGVTESRDALVAGKPKPQEDSSKAIKTDENGEQFKDYEISVLKAHNDFRSKHGGPDMTLNRDLCDMAQKYAEYLLEKDLFEHSSKSQRKFKGEYVGENLGYYMGPGFESYDSTVNWYKEIKDYDFSSAEFSGKTGHFTQVVWKESISLGVGVAKNPTTKKAMMVGRYYPGGNIVGRFAENVLPPR